MISTEEEEEKNEQDQEEALEVQKSECPLPDQIESSCCCFYSIEFVSVIEGVHQDEPKFKDEADSEEDLVAR